MLSSVQIKIFVHNNSQLKVASSGFRDTVGVWFWQIQSDFWQTFTFFEDLPITQTQILLALAQLLPCYIQIDQITFYIFIKMNIYLLISKLLINLLSSKINVLLYCLDLYNLNVWITDSKRHFSSSPFHPRDLFFFPFIKGCSHQHWRSAPPNRHKHRKHFKTSAVFHLPLSLTIILGSKRSGLCRLLWW